MKGVVALWVRHLALSATLRRPARSTLVAQQTVAALAPLAPARARELLFRLGRRFLEAHRRPLPFFPETSWAFLEARDAGDSQRRAELDKRAREAWKKRGWDGSGERGEGADPHAALLFGGASEDFPLEDDRFQELAAEVLGPLREAPDGRPDHPERWVYRWEELA
jgi:exodeoxyribonuclease V gamma subunit